MKEEPHDRAQAELAAALWQIDKVVASYKRKLTGEEPWEFGSVASSFATFSGTATTEAA